MSNLIELDLSHNAFKGAVPSRVFPNSLKTLDLSYNLLDDLTGLLSCPNLTNIDVSNNRLKKIPTLPSKLQALDISHNKLSTVIPLR
jgi:Leucine-rich repeat (LRR) protein